MAKRYIWGDPDGIPEGSDFDRQDTTLFGGTYVLNLRDANNTAAATILVDEASDSTDTGAPIFRVKWSIADTQSNGWASDSVVTYHGDIRGVLTDGRVLYWPVGLKMRPVLDT
jgi:hypothetical protein